jgi:glycosyltransferase involved in cell wall biosynthesis
VSATQDAPITLLKGACVTIPAMGRENDDFSQRTWVVMPAYNAAKTLVATYEDLPERLRGRILLVDDGSQDNTVEIAVNLGLDVIQHSENRGYGGNQKTCYRAALERGAHFVVMVHPDYQYDARMALVMVEILALGNCDVVLGNRIRTRREALKGGMPLWKYVANRLSTFIENLILGQSIGDFHSGMRAYSRQVLATLPLEHNSDDFAFDQEFLVQAVAAGFRIGDVPVPVRYMSEASSINFRRSMAYAWGGLRAVTAYLMHRTGLHEDPRFVLLDGR